MSFHFKGALLLLLLCLAANPATLAQEKRASANRPRPVTLDRSEHKPTKARPVTTSEGLAILGAALDSRHHAGYPSDCSHFVHELYERAGFPYGYASSSELYTGIDEFQRVASPQPGDLAVWLGHAGIVVNPAQHSFLSLLRSGPGVDSYDSLYWKQRGRPRFFRYSKAPASAAHSSSIRTVNLKPADLVAAKPDDSAVDAPVLDVLDESSSPSRPSAKLAERQLVSPTIPHVLVLNSVRPTPDQVSAAFLRACTDSEENFSGRDLFGLAQSLIVFNHLEVRKVHIKGNQDWAEVQIDELASLTGGKTDVHKRSAHQRWLLSRRNNTSWELTPSTDMIYLPRPIAVRILAHALAKLTEASPDTASTQEKAELARLLDVLLQN